MVEYTPRTNSTFAALADPVRRDIIDRTMGGELSVNQIAVEYDMSLAAVSKHLKVLQQAGLISKRKDGRYQFVSARIEGLREAVAYMQQFEQLWTSRLNALEGSS